MTVTVCLVGNPNCGKTTLFNALTGSHQHVGNWPGVTIEQKAGRYTHQGTEYEVIDLPGIYSLVVGGGGGEDERVARDFILSHQAQAVINIVDAGNLARNLYLTIQLIEMRVPILLVVNMIDMAEQQNLTINLEALGKALGCPVVGIVASKSRGLDTLREKIAVFLCEPTIPPLCVDYGPRIDVAHRKLERELASDTPSEHPHWLAIELLENANRARESLLPETLARLQPILTDVELAYSGSLDIRIVNARYASINRILEQSVRQSDVLPVSATDKIDAVVLNRILGIPIFLGILYMMFLFTQKFGSAFIDFFDILIGGIAVTWFGEFLTECGVPDIAKIVLADGIGGGLQTVSTFIPIVFFLFLFLSILEDSGYMARAAFVMDRFMRCLGLSGKSFVPLIVGFGCNVPAVMATRTLDRVYDRVVTVLMTPFMSCSARLPVYVLFATIFFPETGQNILLGLYVLGIIAAVLTGFLIKRLVLQGESAPFVMELPPYHMPSIQCVLLRTWIRLKDFVCRAGRVIVVIVACLSILNSLGIDGSLVNENTERSVLSSIGKEVAPVLAPLGVTEDNWPAAVGAFTGVLAKEAVIGTMDSLYAAMAEKTSDGPQSAEPWSLSATLKTALRSVQCNLEGLADSWCAPLGLRFDAGTDPRGKLQEQVDLGGARVMKALFQNDRAAMAYLLFILLYMPCAATLAAIWREIGGVWTMFSAVWSCALGYSAATICYQMGEYASNPTGAMTAMLACVAVLTTILWSMRHLSERLRRNTHRVISIATMGHKCSARCKDCSCGCL